MLRPGATAITMTRAPGPIVASICSATVTRCVLVGVESPTASDIRPLAAAAGTSTSARASTPRTRMGSLHRTGSIGSIHVLSERATCGADARALHRLDDPEVAQ